MQPSIGISLPQHGHAATFSAKEVARFAIDAERAGFSHLWTSDGIFSPGAFLEPLHLLAFAAAHTGRIRLGVAALVLPRRHPFQLAHAAATLDHLSEGRLDLAVAAGEPRAIEDFIRPEERGAYVEEAVAVMRRLWEHEKLDATGPRFPLRSKTLNPKPLQKPFPLWFGGSRKPALARAARWGTGWIGSGASSTPEFASTVASMREALIDAGRNPQTFPLGKRAYVAIDQPAQACRDWFSATYASPVAGERAASATIRGSVDDVGQELRRIQDAGAELLIINPVGAELEQFSIVAEQLLPTLAAGADDTY